MSMPNTSATRRAIADAPAAHKRLAKPSGSPYVRLGLSDVPRHDLVDRQIGNRVSALVDLSGLSSWHGEVLAAQLVGPTGVRS